jgi:hypothetical protein
MYYKLVPPRKVFHHIRERLNAGMVLVGIFNCD